MTYQDTLEYFENNVVVLVITILIHITIYVYCFIGCYHCLIEDRRQQTLPPSQFVVVQHKVESSQPHQ